LPDILHRIQIDASPDKVFEALSTQAGLGGWWTLDTAAAPNVGAVLQFRFSDRGFNKMEVLELSKGSRVRWKCVDGAAEWIGTEVTFDLRPSNDRTVVLFAHRGWKEQIEFMHYCSTKWATYMLSLKHSCETGKGMPFPNDIDIG
jgi:uncharacterized protein YndB with AHSA1/START domain